MSKTLIRRMCLRTFLMTERHFNKRDIQEPPIRRAIARYGCTSIARQLASFLKVPLDGNLRLSPESFVRSIGPLIICVYLVDPKIGEAYIDCGVYRALIRYIWLVVKSDLGEEEEQSALYFSLASLN